MPESGLIPTQYGPSATGLLGLALALLQNTDILWKLQGGGKPNAHLSCCSSVHSFSLTFPQPSTLTILVMREQLVQSVQRENNSSEHNFLFSVVEYNFPWVGENFGSLYKD